MKRSNLHLGILFLISVISFTIVLLTNKRERIVCIRSEKVKTLNIHNIKLKKEDIIVHPYVRIPQKNDAENTVQDFSHLYYSTDRISHCAPALAIYSDDQPQTFIIAEVRNLKKGETSRLHVCIDGLQNIRLNGEEVWKAPNTNENNPEKTER